VIHGCRVCDAIEPGAERRVTAELRQGTVSVQQSVLDDVLSRPSVLHDVMDERVETLLVRIDDEREGMVVAALGGAYGAGIDSGTGIILDATPI
jgi:hypothetical protein